MIETAQHPLATYQRLPNCGDETAKVPTVLQLQGYSAGEGRTALKTPLNWLLLMTLAEQEAAKTTFAEG